MARLAKIHIRNVPGCINVHGYKKTKRRGYRQETLTVIGDRKEVTVAVFDLERLEIHGYKS